LVAAWRSDDAFLANLGLETPTPVLTTDEQHPADQERDDDNDEPRAERELGDREDHRHDPGRDRSGAVDRDAPPPSVAPVPPPVDDHAGLRQRDRGEYPDGIQRDESFDPSSECRQDDDRENREGDDSGAEREPFPAKREPAGHE